MLFCFSDINECDTSPCDQTCINTEGGFMCFCEEGDLAADGTSCITEELALVEEKRGENGKCFRKAKQIFFRF